MGLFKKTKIKSSKKENIKKTYKKGYLNSVINKKGKKKSVYITQRIDKSGFSALYIGSNKFITNSRNGEKLAIKLAKKGHKKVIFRD